MEAVDSKDADVASNAETLAPIEPPPPSEASIVSNLLSTDVDKVLIVDAKLPLYALALANAPAAASTFVNNLVFTEDEKVPSKVSNLLSNEDDKLDIVLSCDACDVANAPLTLFKADAADADTASTTTNLLFTEDDKFDTAVSCPASLVAIDALKDESSESVANPSPKFAIVVANAPDTLLNSASVAYVEPKFEIVVANAPLTELRLEAALALNDVYSALDAETLTANAPDTELKSLTTLSILVSNDAESVKYDCVNEFTEPE